MSDVTHRQQLELRLKAELDEAEEQLRNATPEKMDPAEKHFRKAVHNFAIFALEGRVPLFLVPPKSTPQASMAETVTIPVGTPLKDAEKRIIEATFQHTHGNVTITAKILGIDRTTLYAKIRRYNIR